MTHGLIIGNSGTLGWPFFRIFYVGSRSQKVVQRRLVPVVREVLVSPGSAAEASEIIYPHTFVFVKGPESCGGIVLGQANRTKALCSLVTSPLHA